MKALRSQTRAQISLTVFEKLIFECDKVISFCSKIQKKNSWASGGVSVRKFTSHKSLKYSGFLPQNDFQ